MSIKDALRPFKKRLTAEAAVRSAVLAGMIAACIAMALGIVHMLLPTVLSEVEILLIFVGIFAVGFGVIFLFLFRPTQRDVAKRLDGLGLSERVETMLEYEYSTAPAATLQRKDTLDRLKAVQSRDVRIRIPKLTSILCAAFLVCASVLLFLPEVNAFGTHPLIQAMRDQVADSDISDELREDLEDIIDDLEEELKENGEEGKKDENGALQEAGDKIFDEVAEEVSKNEIGKELQGFKELKELGMAIEKGDKEGVSGALDKLEEKLKNDTSLREEIAEQLKTALDLSGTPEDNRLYIALDHMSENLQNTDRPLSETMQQAESEIHEALDQQGAAQELEEQLKELLENAKPSDPSEEGEEQGENGQEGNGQDGEQEGEKPNQGNQQGGNSGNASGEGQDGPGNGSGGDVGMNEIIEDPEQGSVKYGSVYASYFAEFLKQVEEGQLPDSVVATMNEYLEQLKNQN